MRPPQGRSKNMTAGQGAALGLWKGAIQQVQDNNRQLRSSSGGADEVLSVGSAPSIIAERQLSGCGATPAATPKLAIMVHRARNLPGSSSSSSNGEAAAAAAAAPTHSFDGYYVRAGLRSTAQPLKPMQQQKTHALCPAGGHVCWPEGILQLQPHAQLQELEVLLQLKRRTRLTGRSVVVGSVTIPLSEVVAAPKKWGTIQHLQLEGHRAGAAVGPAAAAAAAGCPVLEVQLFLALATVPSPLQVLCATWNVGNALPPPQEQLQEWLRGAAEGQHHLIAVAAQECNYTKDMRRYMSQQHHRVSLNTSQLSQSAADGSPPTPQSARAAAAAAAAFAANTGRDLQTGASSTGGASVATADAPLTPTAADVAAGPGRVSDQAVQQQPPQLLQQQGSMAAGAAGAGVDGDALLLPHRLGSTRAVLKAKLVDAVDSSAMWERHISGALGDKYWLVRSKHMFQTRLLLFARADVVPSLSNISSGFEATGIGHVGVNKGGVAIGVKVGATHIAFVGSHLAAHQSKTQQRNRDVAEICHELNLQASAAAAGADLVTGFHHVVWMGDLNYRLEYGQQAVNQADSPSLEDFASLCDTISQQQYSTLLLLDQLRRERDAGRVFAGFNEGSITFAPTFQVHRGEPGFSYAPKRSPAWCDRVLFKSALPHKQATCASYFPAPDICSSDHKPVAAVLALPMAERTVSCTHHHHQHNTSSGAASPPGAVSPQRSLSPVGSSSSKVLSSGSSWGSAALARLGTFGMFSRRNSSSSDSNLYRLFIASVSLGDADTWQQLAKLADSSGKSIHWADSSGGGSKHAAAQQEAAAAGGIGGLKGSMSRSSSGVPAAGFGGSRHKLRLQLVVSGACMSGLKQQQVLRLSPDAMCAAATAEQQPSLLLREDSVQLLPGPLSQLNDDWLLVRLVLSEGWRSKRVLARGVLPLQPVVAAYRSSYKAVPVTLQLESSSVAVGSLVCGVQLISSASIRAGMHEAIRRMRTMAAATRSASANIGERAGAASGGGRAAAGLHRGVSAPAGVLRHTDS